MLMTMRKILFVAAGALGVALVVSCGGNDTSTPFGTPSGSSSGTGTGTGTGTGSSTKYEMGSGSGSSFQNGMIGISNASLSAGGTATLQVAVVNADDSDALYTGGAITVTFSSSCIAQGLATVAASGTTTAGSTANTFSTSTGIAEVTYTAAGCSGQDVVTATSSVSSTNLQASGTLTVAAAAIGSLQFVSATPPTIGLKGTGLAETSTVIFKVVDSTGGPRPGATVTFSLNTTVGGLSLAPSSAVSGADGAVQTVVSSGTVHTAVRVTASIASPALSTQSSVLTVTTGLPASAAFSIAVGPPTYGTNGLSSPPACPNVEAYSIDGVIVPITVRLADRYNNPAPDGTAVAFNTDGGHVGGNCTTPSSPANSGDGTCSVNWTSANPRPVLADDSPPLLANGRAQVLATAIGEESFTDVHGSGFYQPGDPFQNLGDPYRDDNENGQYDLGEYFLDYFHTGKYEAGSGTFIGITCTGTSAGSTCTTSTLAIGAEHLIIMSTSTANITLLSYSGGFSVSGGVLQITHGQSGSLVFNVVDQNNNPIASGSTIAISADPSVGTVDGLTANYTEGCSTHLGGDDYSSNVVAASAAGSGNVYVQVTSSGTKSLSTLSVPVQVN